MKDRFIHIYWYIIGTTGFSLLYVLAVTFLPVPKENVRFADAAQGFLLGQLVGSGVGFLLTRSAQGKAEAVPGTATVDIQATATNTADDKPA